MDERKIARENKARISEEFSFLLGCAKILQEGRKSGRDKSYVVISNPFLCSIDVEKHVRYVAAGPFGKVQMNCAENNAFALYAGGTSQPFLRKWRNYPSCKYVLVI